MLSPGVRVDVGAVVRDSIVMFDSVIRSGAVVDRSILDKEVVVGQGAIVGDGPYDDRPNKQEPSRLNTGITVVGKRAVDPARRAASGATCGSRPTSGLSDFVKRVIQSGESVEPSRRRSAARTTHEPDVATGDAGRRGCVAGAGREAGDRATARPARGRAGRRVAGGPSGDLG